MNSDFDKTDLYCINLGFQGKRFSLFEMAKWKNGLAFKNIEFSDSGVPIIKIAELNNGINSNTAYTQNKYSEEVHLKKGDFVFSWSGNPETSIDIFKFNIFEGWLNQHIFKVTPNDSLVEKNFFYFLMKYLKPYFKKIASNKQTTGLGHVTISDLKRMNLNLPPLEIQKKIAAVLSALDDKIETNNVINKNLEQQLDAIYQNIFMSEEDFIELGDVIETSSGGTPSRNKKIFYENANINWVKSKELNNGYIIDTEENINEIAIKNSSAKILPIHSVLIAMYGATVGKYGIISKPMTCNQAVCALIQNKNYPYSYLYQVAKKNKQNLINLAIGSAQQNISQILIKKIMVHSNIDKIQKFNKFAESIHNQMEILQIENKKLAEMRDLLLPRLLNGEIDVSAVEI